MAAVVVSCQDVSGAKEPTATSRVTKGEMLQLQGRLCLSSPIKSRSTVIAVKHDMHIVTYWCLLQKPYIKNMQVQHEYVPIAVDGRQRL